MRFNGKIIQISKQKGGDPLKVCKVCGSEYEEKPRFCPKCGSYFIDVNDPYSERQWKGVVRADGTVSESASTYVNPLNEKNRQKGARELRVSKAALAWSIVGLIFSSIVLRLVIICFFSEMEMAIMAFPFAVVSFISINKGQGGMRKAAMFMLIASAIIFLIGIFRGTFFS